MGSQRRLLVPFFIVAFVQALFIGLAWLAPQPPFSILLAPPVRYFYGERVLHYPWHLWFLYFSMKHAHLFTSLVLGAFMSGVACAMVQRIHQQSSLTVHEVLATGSVRYGRMAILWLATWGLAKGLMTAMEQFAPRTPWMLWTAIGAMVVLQALFAYAIPASVFEGSPWWKALWQSLRETGRYPLSTLLVVLPPSAAVIAFSITATPNRLAQWMAHTAPEIAVALVAARLLVWTLADAVLTVGLCHLWWFHRTPAVVLESAGKAIPEVTGKPLSRGAVTA
ncbi:MAG: hypothetical protein HYZ92_00370 [Candidatus Omnitrophica bacterium]|nr:hypothetical protein [Candidatus Omnitrophota bacterium]